MIEFILSNFIIGMLGGLIISGLFLCVRIVVGTMMYAVEGMMFIRRRITR